MDMMIIMEVDMDMMITTAVAMDITEDRTHLNPDTPSHLIPTVKHWRSCWPIFPSTQDPVVNTMFPLTQHLTHTHRLVTNHPPLTIPQLVTNHPPLTIPHLVTNPPTHIILHLPTHHILIMNLYLLYKTMLRFHLMTQSPVWMKLHIILLDHLTLFMK